MPHLMFVDASKINIDAVVRAVALGHDVTFVETDVFRTVYADPAVTARLEGVRRLTVPGWISGEAAMAAVADYHRARPVDGLLTMLEQNIEGVSRLGRRLGIRATAQEGVALAKNKGRARQALEKAGLATCRHAVVDSVAALRDAAAALGFPFVVKPVTGYGKLLTRSIAGAGELDQFLTEYGELRAGLSAMDQGLVSAELIVEEYIQGPMFSVEIGVDERGVYPFMVTERRRPDHNPVIEIGSTMPTGAPASVQESLIAYAGAVVRALGLDLGIFHLEIIVDANKGPVLVEANPRLMGGTLPMLYTRATDNDIYDDLARIHAGQQTGWQPAAPPRYATVRQVAPVVAGVARQDIDPAILMAHCPSIAWSNVQVKKGQAVQPMTCNVQSLGCFHVVAGTYQESLARAQAGLDAAQALLGVEIAR